MSDEQNFTQERSCKAFLILFALLRELAATTQWLAAQFNIQSRWTTRFHSARWEAGVGDGVVSELNVVRRRRRRGEK